MATQAILDQYGWRTVRIPDGSTDASGGSTGASGGIGKTWVPPLGGAGVIVPGAVVEPGYADRLAEAGYQPQRVSESLKRWQWHELWRRSKGVIVALVVVLALAVWASREVD